MLKIVVTGGSGFIGSAVIRNIINHTEHSVLNIDKLTYASNQYSLGSVVDSNRYTFSKTDICDRSKLVKLFDNFEPDIIMHLAAESHVDRSIEGPESFVQTNIVGTYQLLEATRSFLSKQTIEKKNSFRFHHVSTDEVYGDLAGSKKLFTEETPYSPSSPYSASKASSDHLVRAWHRTFGIPVVLTNCSNNYGPYQFPEKLIPLAISCALEGKKIPVYGSGQQIRDWLYVEDHALALVLVATKANVGEAYNIGGFNTKKNIEVVELICEFLEHSSVNKPNNVLNFRDLISLVKDRPGHDTHYAIDATKIKEELGWTPIETFETGLYKTVKWYLENQKFLMK